MMSRAVFAILGLLAFCAGCSGNPESPPATPETISEVFGGHLGLQGATSFSFNVNKAGSVSVTLASVVLSRPGPTTTAALTVGLGAPADGVCSARSSVTTSSGLTAQLSMSLDAGAGCVNISDVGNLTAPVDFTVRVVHP